MTKNTIARLNPAASRVKVVKTRRITEGQLSRAIAEKQLTVHYQPKVTHTDRGWVITGVEALARWESPEFGMVMPNEFIPLAEETGLIAPLTEFVLEAAVSQARQWRDDGLSLVVAVNLAPYLLTDLSLPDRLSNLLTEYDIDGSSLVLEITESAAMTDPVLTMDILTRLRLKDIGLSIDDFGTGYSSLKQLYRMPFNELKIDNSFVIAASDSEEARSIVRATINLAHDLRMNVCAEGVESKAALQYLNSLGCDKAQGYFISRPMPVGGVDDFVRSWNASKHGA